MEHFPWFQYMYLSSVQVSLLMAQTCRSTCLLSVCIGCLGHSWKLSSWSLCTHSLLTDFKSTLNGITALSVAQAKNLKVILDSSLTLTFQINSNVQNIPCIQPFLLTPPQPMCYTQSPILEWSNEDTLKLFFCFHPVLLPSDQFSTWQPMSS